jgi:hypothetical protein
LNLGDLLGLILFVVFFVLPAIGRLQRRTPGAPPAQTGRPVGPPTGAPPGAPTGAPTGRAAAPSPEPVPPAFPPLEDDDLARRLQEARERVRKAMAERQTAPAGSATTAPTPTPRPGPTPKAPPPPAARPTIAGPNPRPKIGGGSDPRARAARPLVSRNLDDGLLGTPLPTAADAPAPRPRAIAHDLRARAPQVEVQRLEERAGQPAAGGIRLPLDARGIRDGFIWHQVLGAPRARRRLGGGPFPER